MYFKPPLKTPAGSSYEALRRKDPHLGMAQKIQVLHRHTAKCKESMGQKLDLLCVWWKESMRQELDLVCVWWQCFFYGHQNHY